MAEQEIAAQKVAVAGKRHYSLFTITGKPGIRWKLKDEGIAIEGDSLYWQKGEVPNTAALKNVREVRLMIGQTKDGVIGTCLITFRNLAELTVSSASAFGLPDDERAPVYAEFVNDLHTRLAAFKENQVAYFGGVSASRFKFGVAAFIIAGAFFVALPIMLLLITGETEALWIAASGVFFVYPMFRSMQRNAPQQYSPDAIPEELLP